MVGVNYRRRKEGPQCLRWIWPHRNDSDCSKSHLSSLLYDATCTIYLGNVPVWGGVEYGRNTKTWQSDGLPTCCSLSYCVFYGLSGEYLNFQANFYFFINKRKKNILKETLLDNNMKRLFLLKLFFNSS